MDIQVAEAEAIRTANATEDLLTLSFRLPGLIALGDRCKLRRRRSCSHGGYTCCAGGFEKIAAREPFWAVCS